MTLSEIKVSIIISIYKTEKYLSRCVESAISQSETAIEIILVNDGSPDNCGKIAEEYAKRDNRVKVIHKINGGAASARNYGLQAAKGKYIVFVDSDDWIGTDFIEVLLNKSVTLNADIVKCNFCYQYKSGAFKIKKNDFPNDFFIGKKDFKQHIYNKLIMGIEMNSVCRILYKKEILEGLEFHENLKTCEDLLFSIKVYTNAKSFAYTDQALYHYFQCSDGLTGSGLSIVTKFKCNLHISKVLSNYIKIWQMDSIKNRLLVHNRLVNITFSKVTRSIKNFINTK